MLCTWLHWKCATFICWVSLILHQQWGTLNDLMTTWIFFLPLPCSWPKQWNHIQLACRNRKPSCHLPVLTDKSQYLLINCTEKVKEGNIRNEIPVVRSFIWLSLTQRTYIWTKLTLMLEILWTVIWWPKWLGRSSMYVCTEPHDSLRLPTQSAAGRATKP